MRLPTSTIVMTLVTCVPFGLAIRDTVRNADASAAQNFYDDGDDHDVEPDLDYAARAAEHEAAERTAAAADGDAIKQVYGAEVASLGPLFEGITLGASSQSFQPEAARKRIEAFRTAHDFVIDFDLDATSLNGISIEPEHPSACRTLSAALRLAWGSGMDRSPGWLNPTTRTRAIFEDTETCRLRFERYLPLDAWLDTEPSSGPSLGVPLWVIGKPVAKLLAAIPNNGDVSDNEVTWIGLPLAMTRASHFDAVIKNGKVAGFTVYFESLGSNEIDPFGPDTTGSTYDLKKLLTDMFGRPKTDNEGKLVWAKPAMPPITLDATSSYTGVLTVGHP